MTTNLNNGGTRPLGQVLWRMQGPTRIVAASLRPVANGFELRVGYEPHGVGEVLSRETAGGLFPSRRLQQRARRLAAALESRGWTPLALSPPVATGSRRTWPTIGVLAAAVGLVGTAGWMRRRTRRHGVSGQNSPTPPGKIL